MATTCTGPLLGQSGQRSISAATSWHLSQDDAIVQAVIAESGYGGSPRIAYLEAFRREAAIALELVVKAVIAQQMTMRQADPAREGVPATHDLPSLWALAGCPKLGHEDRYRLLLCKSILIWSGRYATPLSEEAWHREEAAFRALQPPTDKTGRLRIIRPIPLGWSEFNRLFRIAADRFWALHEEQEKGMGD